MADLKRQLSLIATLKRAVAFCKTIETTEPTLSELEVRLNRLNVEYVQFLEIQQKIENTCSDKTLLETEFGTRGQAEDFYFFCSSALNEAIRRRAGPAVTNQQPAPNNPQSNVLLPRIDIPTFSGIYQEWPSFQDHFVSLIHGKANLSDVEKFHYLKGYLTGEAAELIRSVQITNANYAEAWKLIKDRYDNKRFIVDAHLRSLVNLPQVRNDDPKTLKRLIDIVLEATRALAVMGLPTNQWDALIVHMIVARLDPESHKQWELQLTKNELPTFRQLETFIENRWQSLEMIGPIKFSASSLPQAKRNFNTGRKSQSFVTTSSSTPAKTRTTNCPLCNAAHPIYICSKFREMSFEAKIDTVKTHHLCFNCLKPDHNVGSCSIIVCCRHCGKRHHSSIHKPNIGSASTTTVNQSRNDFNHDLGQQATTSTNVHLASGSHQILLSTAIVLIKSNSGQLLPVRALLDSGSQSTFVTESLITKLGLKRNPTNTFLSGIGQTLLRKATSIVDINISSYIGNSFVATTRALTIDKITGNIPGETIRPNNWPHLSNLTLADPQYHQAREVEMLIGSDIYGEILIDGLISKRNGSPFAQNTKFGWVLFGKITDTNISSAPSHIYNFHVETNEDSESQESILRKFWEIEEVDLTRKPSREETWAEEHFQRTHSRDFDGRYTVFLPFNDNSTPLGESKSIAVRQLFRMEKRFKNDSSLRNEYSAFMREYLELNHMEKVPPIDLSLKNENVFYLPHHAVRNESSVTTKLRVVFNGSMKTSTCVSLNEKLLVGPTLQDDLFSIIVRWREHKVVLNADIAKMYRQIRMNPEHSNYQRIVWRFSESEPVTDYRLTTVTYGTASAAFLAIRALQQLARDECHNYPTEANIILRDFYVDDLMTGSHDVSSALQIQRNLIELTQKGGFPLRKWNSNYIELLKDSVESGNQQPLVELMDKSVKILGICWNPNEDCFQFKISETPNLPRYSKREILSSIAKQFDPFGWISPVIILAKIILQRLWLTGISWDDPVPDDIATTWENYKNQLSSLGCIKIDRWIGSPDIEIFELHGFCDASNDAYAAVVYSRSVSKCGKIKVNLIGAKTKVAPIKQLSTPRLELNGAVLLSRLINKIKISFVHRIDQINTFTDSTVVLAWIKGHPNQWKNFVANRLTEIHRYTDITSWKFVKSGDNPADCASRGVLPQNLQCHPLWWHGPVWLGQPNELWPSHNHLQFKTNVEERRVIKTFLVTAANPWLLVFEKYSSLDKLVRIVAYWMRLVELLRRKTSTHVGILSVPELRAAKLKCIRMAQRADFGSEIQCLVAGEQLPSKSCIGSLNPYLDGDGTLRVGGRLSKSCLLPQGKFPIILSNKNYFSKLLILKAHETTLHGGVGLTMANLRTQFWIVGMRSLVRKCIHECNICYRYRCQAANQMMADLPSPRVRPSRPFLHSGVDFAGPITTKLYKGKCKIMAKSYISVFVCMVTKAIHLELVSELTSEAFLACFRRFIARRGRCSDIYSDCGTNFVGANREMKNFESQLRHERFQSMLVNDGTTWHFNPPASPHFGGLWEAGVKSVKSHLQKIVGKSIFTFEEMYTVLCQIEACLNSRPLCPLSDTIDDLEYLTPGHFLVGEPTLMMPNPSILHIPENRLSRWQLMQQRVQGFWKAWSGEYLSRLQQRPKWTRRVENIQEGQLALIREDNVPPSKWIVGRVTKTLPGDDGNVRVVWLKTATGAIKRPIVKLSILPIPTAQSSEDVI